jgi:formamidopyrimidine-DNA glycosylase
MPELPDIVVYIEALEQRILGATLKRVAVTSPFLLRTALPPLSSVAGRSVIALRRLGKRICIGLEDDLWLVLHLMIAGRLHWKVQAQSPKSKVQSQPNLGTAGVSPADRGSSSTLKEGENIRLASKPRSSRSPKNSLATFDFSTGTLSLTEAGTQRRASLHLISGETGLQQFERGGLEVFESDVDSFGKVLRSENHTLKRALTDPRLLSGIGNAYSDEILWEAQLSPVALTQKLSSEEIERLFNSIRTTLTKWIDILRSVPSKVQPPMSKVQIPRSQAQDESSQNQEDGLVPAPSTTLAFPEHVTAFRPEMAVHGKYQQPCPRCGASVQRIRYASNETNYCPRCQTGGKLLADRALSRLLRSDWPRTADELENLARH